jgi:hypothetical protein
MLSKGVKRLTLATGRLIKYKSGMFSPIEANIPYPHPGSCRTYCQVQEETLGGLQLHLLLH